MLKSHFLTALLSAAVIAGCSGSDGPLRYPVPQVAPTEKVRIGYRTVLVREVSLPEYAALSEISVQTPEGGIVTSKAQLWADNPVRAITLELSRTLGQITGATVASDPWPFDTTPGAQVEVRIEEMLTDNLNSFRLAGQYFVGPTDGSNRNRARVFSLSVPLPEGASPQDLATARGKIIADLALLIARDGLR